MSISSARGRDLWELPECDAPLALTGVSAKGKGAAGGVVPPTNRGLSEKKQGENVTGRHTPPLQSLPYPGSRAQSLLLAPRIAVYY